MPSGECIKLFSGCNYSGESIEACDNLGKLKYINLKKLKLRDFNYPIHSIYIPDGYSITIY
jgi:hypothetical protein